MTTALKKLLKVEELCSEVYDIFSDIGEPYKSRLDEFKNTHYSEYTVLIDKFVLVIQENHIERESVRYVINLHKEKLTIEWVGLHIDGKIIDSKQVRFNGKCLK